MQGKEKKCRIFAESYYYFNRFDVTPIFEIGSIEFH